MSVAPEIAGITSKHIAAIEQTCRETNTFLLVRPSTKETMELIDEGYATKSMDIHDKSSDWGPAAGFVPCDPAFSKALKGSPNPHLHPHPHGAALPIQLRLTEKLANPASNPKLVAADPSRSATGDKRHVKAAGGTANGPKGKVFELKKQGNGWDVSWLNGDKPVPLMVWGYRAGGEIKPVTGDYDLWMVAPHISRWSEHTQVMGIQDEHGESGATMFITHLLRKLNSACGRSDNPVFNHGAESQNYGFTQSIDPKLAMFTPCGTSRMVDIGDLPGVLVDMQSAGYLVYWNKRYGEREPELMGSAFHGSVSGGGGGSGIEQLLAEARALKDTPAGNDPLAHQLRQSPLVQKALLGRGGEAGKIQAIQQFYKTMQSELKQLSEQGKSRPLGKLNVGVDIPDSVMQKARADFDVRHKLQQELQEAMVALSEMDRGYTKSGPTAGAALAPDPAKYERWSAKNQSLLMKLEKAFGKTNSPLHFERIPGTRAYKTFAPRKTGQRVGALIEKMGLK